MYKSHHLNKFSYICIVNLFLLSGTVWNFEWCLNKIFQIELKYSLTLKKYAKIFRNTKKKQLLLALIYNKTLKFNFLLVKNKIIFFMGKDAFMRNS